MTEREDEEWETHSPKEMIENPPNNTGDLDKGTSSKTSAREKMKNYWEMVPIIIILISISILIYHLYPVFPILFEKTSFSHENQDEGKYTYILTNHGKHSIRLDCLTYDPPIMIGDNAFRCGYRIISIVPLSDKDATITEIESRINLTSIINIQWESMISGNSTSARLSTAKVNFSSSEIINHKIVEGAGREAKIVNEGWIDIESPTSSGDHKLVIKPRDGYKLSNTRNETVGKVRVRSLSGLLAIFQILGLVIVVLTSFRMVLELADRVKRKQK